MQKTSKHVAIVAVIGVVAVLLLVAVIGYANTRNEVRRAQVDISIGNDAEEDSYQLLRDLRLDRIVNARHIDPSEEIGDAFACLKDGTIISVAGTKYRISVVADTTVLGGPTPKMMPTMMISPRQVPSGPPIKIEDATDDTRVSLTPTG